MTALHAPWRALPAFRALEAAFAAAGQPLYYVGGALRDLLLARPVLEVDAATPATPEQMQGLLAQAGLRSLPTGIDHGTLTVLLTGEGPWSRVEITTFRADRETDGRHASVAFGADLATDAARRDFTMNALYLDGENRLHDPTEQGRADIAARRLRFIGDPARRIAEDALRMLRFYRFAAQLDLPALDAGARDACARSAAQLDRLSGERVGQEMRKLLTAPGAASALEAMQQDGLLSHVLPIPIVPSLVRAETIEGALGMSPDLGWRLASLLRDARQCDWLAARWRLSRAEVSALHWLVGMAPDLSALDEPAIKRVARRRGKADTARLLALAWTRQAAPPLTLAALAALLRDWDPPVFPLGGQDLLASGHAPGPALGRRLAALEQAWEASDYRLTRDDLLQMRRGEP